MNGRVMTSQDVLCSFQRQIALKANSGLLPPWESIAAPDASTVQFKL